MSTKDIILKTATKIFADRGYGGTSVRDICDEAKVAVSAISYHFGSKEDLFKAIIEEFGKKHLDFTLKSLSDPTNSEVFQLRLEMFVDSLVVSLLEDPAAFRLVQKEIDNRNPKIDEVFNNKIMKMFTHLVGYLDAAKENAIIDRELDTTNAASFLLNHITSNVKSDDLTKKIYKKSLTDDEYRQAWLKSTLGIFIGGIQYKGKS